MTTDEQRALIESYSSATSDRLVAALDRVPRDRWQARPSPDGWTAHEIVVHLCDSEANSYVRIRKPIAEPGSAVAAFDEQRWQAALGYHETDPDEALALFRALRRQTHRLLTSLPDDAWSRASEHPEFGTMTVGDWLRSERDHLSGHIAQVESLAVALERNRGES
jgi:uncharacterized damage-inducible protein DinB